MGSLVVRPASLRLLLCKKIFSIHSVLKVASQNRIFASGCTDNSPRRTLTGKFFCFRGIRQAFSGGILLRKRRASRRIATLSSLSNETSATIVRRVSSIRHGRFEER
jgi:hypothetical protein